MEAILETENKTQQIKEAIFCFFFNETLVL